MDHKGSTKVWSDVTSHFLNEVEQGVSIVWHPKVRPDHVMKLLNGASHFTLGI